MDEETVEHKRQLLAIYEGNLRELEIRTALYGITTPLSIINEMKHARRNIDQLRLTLETNAQAVSFDQLFVSIEQLQSYVFEESQRVIIAYHTMIREARARNTLWFLGMGAFGVSVGIGIGAYQKLTTGEFPEKITLSQFSALFIYGIPTGIRLFADYRYKKQWRIKFEQQFGFPPDPNLSPYSGLCRSSIVVVVQFPELLLWAASLNEEPWLALLNSIRVLFTTIAVLRDL